MAPITSSLQSHQGDRDLAEDRQDLREPRTGLPSDRAALTVQEFCRWAGISRSTFYNLLAAHELKVRKIGNRTVVLCSDARAWLEALPEVGAEPTPAANHNSPLGSADTKPVQSDPQRFLSAAEVAHRFDCSIRTVRRWIADGVLPAATIGGLCRIAESDVEAMVRKNA
ncbi:helix-turn-helix domain-containing protein [Mesorhizobium marinum]|uniref:helix-turn-helix domain-containing protein n=1 Tax=Mesorhizobium marinum TaxID=3228790 RepID=UPI003466E0A0